MCMYVYWLLYIFLNARIYIYFLFIYIYLLASSCCLTLLASWQTSGRWEISLALFPTRSVSIISAVVWKWTCAFAMLWFWGSCASFCRMCTSLQRMDLTWNIRTGLARWMHRKTLLHFAETSARAILIKSWVAKDNSLWSKSWFRNILGFWNEKFCNSFKSKTFWDV